VLLKELIDNALDACEESNVAPKITINVDDRGLTVQDNGPGIPPEVVAGIKDFAVRVSSREAYVSPCRGAQGNALKTVVAMPFVLDGEQGKITISAKGIRHEITVRVDRIRQEPVIEHVQHEAEIVQNGTSITVHSSSSLARTNSLFVQMKTASRFVDGYEIIENDDDEDEDSSSSLADIKSRFVQIADDFTFVNPHVSLTLDWFGDRCLDVTSTNPTWLKWKPSDPTSPHWYGPEHFARLVSAYLAHDAERDNQRTVRDLISQFRGLATSAKQKAVLDATELHRSTLTDLTSVDGASLNDEVLNRLLSAMKSESKPVKPPLLGFIGKEHLAAKFQALDCEMESFNYQKADGTTDGLPWIVETAFAWCPDASRRRIITGVNWSPGIVNPFRELGRFGQSLDTVLTKQRASSDEPVVLLLHLSCPRVMFADRGKSTIVIERG
jgi:DNA topoisomerase VI subunit B